MRVVLQFRTILNSTVAKNDWWLLLKPELLWLLIVNALQLNELSALRNTFYPEYKYVCMYVCMQDDFWTCKEEIFFFRPWAYIFWPESLGIMYLFIDNFLGKNLNPNPNPFFHFFCPLHRPPHHFSNSPSLKLYFRAVQLSIVSPMEWLERLWLNLIKKRRCRWATG